MTWTSLGFMLVGLVLGCTATLLTSLLHRRRRARLELREQGRAIDFPGAGETAEFPLDARMHLPMDASAVAVTADFPLESHSRPRQLPMDPADLGYTQFDAPTVQEGGPAVNVPANRGASTPHSVQRDAFARDQKKSIVRVQGQRGGQPGDAAELDPGYSWAVADTPGLAMDMHMRSVGDIVLVSVRAQESSARLITKGADIPLSAVEIPWYDGTIVNGQCSYTRTERRAPAFELRPAASPEFGSRLTVFALENWVAITEDQPTLAAIAASLFVPTDLSPFESWHERLGAYLSSTLVNPNQVVALVRFRPGEVTVAGNAVQHVWLGTRDASVPSIAVELRDSVSVQPVDEQLNRLWIRKGHGSDWSQNSYVFDSVPSAAKALS